MIFISYVTKYYFKTSTEIRRLEELSFSPVLSNIVEYVNGIVHYRNFNSIDFFYKKYRFNCQRII